jgi:FkbM family methyltransferase
MSKISNFIAAIQNLENWGEYNFHKTERKNRLLNFTTRPATLKFSVDQKSFDVFKEIFIEDFYDIKTIFKHIGNAPTVIDIGANTGFFELLMLSKRPKAMIYAFEPFPNNITLIEKIKTNNPAFQNQIKVIEKAVTDKAGQLINFYVDNNAQQSAIGSIYTTFDNRNMNTINVTTTSLAEIVSENNIQQIDVLKLDCEGAEYDILYAAPKEILKKTKLMLIEVHKIDDADKNIMGIEKFLTANNFRFVSKEFTNGCFYTYAINSNAQ